MGITVPLRCITSFDWTILISEGEIEEANSLLGYDYSIRGTVAEGTHTGQAIGFPTANINPEKIGKLIPDNGVYASVVTMENAERYAAMTNIGCRPTFGGEETTIETNIFNFSRSIYGEMIKIEFVGRIRKEKRFDDVEQLKNQLGNDRETAIEILKSRKI